MENGLGQKRTQFSRLEKDLFMWNWSVDSEVFKINAENGPKYRITSYKRCSSSKCFKPNTETTTKIVESQ